MVDFVFDFAPDDSVFVVIDNNTEDASISIKRATIVENRVVSYLDEESNTVNDLKYLVYLIDDTITKLVDVDVVFATDTEAVDYIRGELEVTPTPTPSVTPTPSSP